MKKRNAEGEGFPNQYKGTPAPHSPADLDFFFPSRSLLKSAGKWLQAYDLRDRDHFGSRLGGLILFFQNNRLLFILARADLLPEGLFNLFQPSSDAHIFQSVF